MMMLSPLQGLLLSNEGPLMTTRSLHLQALFRSYTHRANRLTHEKAMAVPVWQTRSIYENELLHKTCRQFIYAQNGVFMRVFSFLRAKEWPQQNANLSNITCVPVGLGFFRPSLLMNQDSAEHHLQQVKTSNRDKSGQSSWPAVSCFPLIFS